MARLNAAIRRKTGQAIMVQERAGALPPPQLLPAGPDAAVLRFALTPDPTAMAAAQMLAADLSARPPAGMVEIAPALVSVLLRFDPALTTRAALGREVLARAQAIAAGTPQPPPSARRWTIPVAFGGDNGPALGGIAAGLGLTASQAIDQLCTADLRVLTIGFAPGQPYIGLLPPAWNLPRLPDLTPQVPAGAVVVALRQIVIFGAASATGWRQIGRTAFRSFAPDRADPMPLRAGDAIRYAPVTAAEMTALEAAPDALGGARLERWP